MCLVYAPNQVAGQEVFRIYTNYTHPFYTEQSTHASVPIRSQDRESAEDGVR